MNDDKKQQQPSFGGPPTEKAQAGAPINPKMTDDEVRNLKGDQARSMGVYDRWEALKPSGAANSEAETAAIKTAAEKEQAAVAGKKEELAEEAAAALEENPPGTLEEHFVLGSDLKPGDSVGEFGQLLAGEFYLAAGEEANHTGKLVRLEPETESFTLETMRGDVTLVFDDVKVSVAK